MIRRIKPFLTVVVLTLVAVSTPALSQDAGWFAGIGIGHLKTNDACTGTAPPGITCKDKDTTWKILGGYQFNTNFGFELGLVDLGERTASFAGFGPATARFKVFEVLVVGTMPISQKLSVYGKLGIFHWDIDYDVGTGFVGSADASGKDQTYGFGVKYNFTRNVALRLEWQRYHDVGDPSTTGASDFDVFGVGIVFKF